MNEKILCIREIKWEGGVLQQKLLIHRDGQDIEEWRPVPSEYSNRVEISEDRWRTLNWDRSNIEIAAELKYSLAYISQKRAIYGHKHYKHAALSWEGVDWSQSNSQIAKQLGRLLHVVATARFKLGIPPHVRHGSSYNRKIDPEKLAKVDWEGTNDATIARSLGVSRERIRQLRIDLQKPNSRMKYASRTAESLKWLLENREKLTGMHRHEVVRLMPGDVQLPTKYAILRKSGITCKTGKAWKYGNAGSFPLNFALPNKWLGLIWNMSAHLVAQRRMVMVAGPAKWHGGGFSRYTHDPEFTVMLEAEILVAQEKGIKVDTEAIYREVELQRQYVDSRKRKTNP